MLGVAYGPMIRSTLSWVISCSYSVLTLAWSDSSSRTTHRTGRPSSPPESLSRSTNSSPAILWMALAVYHEAAGGGQCGLVADLDEAAARAAEAGRQGLAGQVQVGARFLAISVAWPVLVSVRYFIVPL